MAMTGLIGEVRDQFDLFVRERADFLAEHIDCADQLIVLAHWNGQYRPITAEFDGRDDKWIAIDVGLRSSDVGELGHLLRGRDEAKGAIRRRVNDSRAGLGVGVWRVVHGHGAESLALAEVERAELRLADARRLLQHRLEHRPQLPRRTADDLQDLRGRRLLLQRLGEPVFQVGIGCAKAVNVSSRLRCL